MTRQRIWLELSDAGTADDVCAWLEKNNAKEIDRTYAHGIDPVVFPIIVTAVLIATGGAGTLLGWLRRQGRCLLIVDARGDTVRTVIDCRERQGRTIVVAADGVKVEVLEARDLLDLNELAKTAVTQGAQAAVQLAEAAGASARRLET